MTEPPVYCRVDARQGTPRGLALDGSTPLVYCRWQDQAGKVHGHGLTLGTFDGPGRAAELEADRLARIARQHPAHRTRRGFHRECQACLARGAHLDHIEAGKTAAGCRECDIATTRAWSARVGA